MVLGIPRGYFFYDYKEFIDEIFEDTGIELFFGGENDEKIMERGSELTVDETCIPVKLLAGQIDALAGKCDFVLLLRIMKDFKGRWLCPKLLGIPELVVSKKAEGKIITSHPIYFNDRKDCRKTFARIFRGLGIEKKKFEENFRRAYGLQRSAACGAKRYKQEAAWEFTPPPPGEGEIILPNTKKVFLAGHCYNVCDKFFNKDIMKKLDDLGIEAVTERVVSPADREKAVKEAGFAKEPFWEAFVRVFGSAVCLENEVDGIVYLSSFSCGTDSFITEMIKTYIPNLPMMVLKFDEHKGLAGYDTRLEAFSDLLERRAS